MTARVYGLPLDTPLETEPDARMVEATAMLSAATIVLTLGAWDRTIVHWLLGKNGGIVATIASWLRRSWHDGLCAGRAEGVAEAETDLHVLAADIDRLADHADTRLTEGEAGAQEVLEDLLSTLRARVSVDTVHADHLAEVAARARRRYFSILAGDLSADQRHMAVTIAVDTAAVTTTCDSTLAAAVRAVITADRELDDALAEVGDPDDLPGDSVRSVVLPAADAGRVMDTLEAPDGRRTQWTHRADFLVDVRLTPADVAQLRAADADTDASIAEDGQLVVEGRRYEVTVGWPRGTRRAVAENQDDDVLQPGADIPGAPGMVAGTCGHRVAGSEWRAGYRTCERCPADDGHSTPLTAAGLAAGALGIAGLTATHTGSPVLGLVLATVGGITGAAVLVLGRRGRDGGAS